MGEASAALPRNRTGAVTRLPGLAHPLREALPSVFVLSRQFFSHIASKPQPEGELELLIGPEGGLSEREQELALSQGAEPVALGPRVLRTETAPIAALAAINALWGDFRG